MSWRDALPAVRGKLTVVRFDDLRTKEVYGLLGPSTAVHDLGNPRKTFRFANYYETMAFVNALAFFAHRQDHHPDLGVHYDRCVVRYSTHDAGGLTQNDLDCAANAERLAAG